VYQLDSSGAVFGCLKGMGDLVARQTEMDDQNPLMLELFQRTLKYSGGLGDAV
jgi:hypothetical protein